ncbi:dolichyl-phosphate beta-glucosyltransferase [Jejuia spongiicola]|uniref:dolichyl-phosphate beta-glucosyltransferase n=1 Tax=Jejuia spongiicola TaxID=2942207 RepID=A0ABT0QAG2_9FLAO|nr:MULTISPECIES: dolichyl-phosphate beta-glucosyltransferase [Flavobacteriaceae]MCL6293967.1 glycosyltransferase family 2 protein [Jejuia spongiicola]PIA78503.1 glycosyl transferase family 2 [Gaetbulibacter sp. 4G1]
MKTGIIIPCYNEEKRLDTKAFIKFIQSHNKYHLCFVNDGSKDNTLKVLQDIQEQAQNKISIVDVKKNAGKAAAVRSGARYLYNRQDIDYIGFIDADLSTDFKDFKKLVDTLHNNDKLSLVYGSRGKGEGQIERNLFRNVFSKMVKMIVYLILGLPIEDTQCGAKVFKRNIIPVAYDNSFLTRWLFDVEIFLRLKKHFGSKNIMNCMYEQPLDRWVHVDDSKLGIKDALQIPLMLVNIWFSYTILSVFANIIEEGQVIATDDITIISTYNISQQIAA